MASMYRYFLPSSVARQRGVDRARLDQRTAVIVTLAAGKAVFRDRYWPSSEDECMRRGEVETGVAIKSARTARSACRYRVRN